jgi:hypothetical protein
VNLLVKFLKILGSSIVGQRLDEKFSSTFRGLSFIFSNRHRNAVIRGESIFLVSKIRTLPSAGIQHSFSISFSLGSFCLSVVVVEEEVGGFVAICC